ncbi:MAG: helix-turn-helix domain-containing protein [Fusobacteriaceae bacterium]
MATIKRLGGILKQLRESRNLTIISLATKANIGIGTIGDIERGKNNSKESTLEKIVTALNLSKEERLGLYSGILPEDVALRLINKEKLTINQFMKETQEIFSDPSVSSSKKEKLILYINEVYYNTKKKY